MHAHPDIVKLKLAGASETTLSDADSGFLGAYLPGRLTAACSVRSARSVQVDFRRRPTAGVPQQKTGMKNSPAMTKLNDAATIKDHYNLLKRLHAPASLASV